MALRHVKNDVSPQIVAEALRTDGYVIVDELASNDLMDRVADEMASHIALSPFGRDRIAGKLTKRTGALIARSPAARELIMNPLALAAAGRLLDKASNVQIILTQVISLHPGSPAQPLHQDQCGWDFFPFPEDYHMQCNLLWAMTDYTDEMGATRIVPGSQSGNPDKQYDLADSEPAIMTRGSALFYTGKVHHGAGHNRTNKIRQAVNINYGAGWIRQEENQYLSTPLEIARTLPDDLLKLMGYQLGCFPIGHTRDFESPMVVIRDAETRQVCDVRTFAKSLGPVAQNLIDSPG